MHCRDTTTDLTLDEAFVVLEPYYLATQERFLEAGLDRCAETRFFVAPNMHDTERHFAACSEDGKKILVAPELVELPPEIVLAICAHELGHACDFLYPGEFAYGGDDAPAIRRLREEMKPGQWHGWLRDWRKRDDDLVERSADAIAHFALGVRYGYQGPCLLQSFSGTEARPYALR